MVTTDSLGPEEVVEHGRNGLIVPAADAPALAAAIERLVDEPDLLPRLGHGGGARVRQLDEQVAGLEATYAELLAAAPAGAGVAAQTATIQRVLFVVGIEGAPLRYRARLPAEGLALVGVVSDVRHYRDPDLDELARRADAVVFYRVPATVEVLGLIERIREAGTPLFFDVDDLIFDPDLEHEIPAVKILPHDEAELWMQGVRRYRTTLEACDVYIGSTAALCRAAEEVAGVPAERFANGVGIALSRLSDAALARPRRPGPVRIGYFSGTDTHTYDWLHVEPALVQAMQRHPDVELWLGGHLPDSAALAPFADRIRRFPVLPWTELPDVLRDLDVNLAPLEPGKVFNEAKSAIKWLEAALTATPTIASPTEPYREAIVDGENGLLADTPEEWVEAVERLVGDAEARERIGRRARRGALLRWSPHLQGRRYLEILARGRSRTAAGDRSRFEPVALDEPALPTLHPLELYDAPAATRRQPSRLGVAGQVRRTKGLAARGWSSWRRDGAAATARKLARLTRVRAPARPGTGPERLSLRLPAAAGECAARAPGRSPPPRPPPRRRRPGPR